MVAKKVSATKTAAKKSTAKTAVVSTSTVVDPEVTEIARQALVRNSHWLSGRERDEMVKAAGHDPAVVRAEMHRLRTESPTSDNG